jgi:hypothetical protein
MGRQKAECEALVHSTTQRLQKYSLSSSVGRLVVGVEVVDSIPMLGEEGVDISIISFDWLFLFFVFIPSKL